jgi:hypothetical protein
MVLLYGEPLGNAVEARRFTRSDFQIVEFRIRGLFRQLFESVITENLIHQLMI